MLRSDSFTPKRRRARKSRCRTCRSDNGKRVCPALNGLLICPDCCREKWGKIPGCDQHCRYYSPLIRASKIHSPPDFPAHQCLVSKSNDTGMLTVIVARERLDGNLRAMFLLLDLWKKGIRDCFVDANLSKEDLKRQCEKLGKSYHLAEQPPTAGNEEEISAVDLPKNTIVLEAESTDQIDEGVTIVKMDGASGGKAIDSARGARATHEVNIPKTGKWYVWIRGFFPSVDKNSYWIGMHNAAPNPHDPAGGEGAVRIYSEYGDSVNVTEERPFNIWH